MIVQAFKFAQLGSAQLQQATRLLHLRHFFTVVQANAVLYRTDSGSESNRSLPRPSFLGWAYRMLCCCGVVLSDQSVLADCCSRLERRLLLIPQYSLVPMHRSLVCWTTSSLSSAHSNSSSSPIMHTQSGRGVSTFSRSTTTVRGPTRLVG